MNGEIAIFERGLPPEFRVYIYRDNKPIAAQQVALTVELSRLGGRVDTFDFSLADDYFLGKGEVEEPHSFDVKVVATVDGKTHKWHYESPEGRTTIDADTAKASGIRVAIAGPATLRERLSLYDTIEANTERVRQVSARYPGVIRSVKHQIGDRVPAGAVLATVESNESLQTYSVTAPIAGVVTQRMTNVGESTGDAPLFVVTDLSTVWAELSVFPRDRNLLAAGQEVQVVATDGGQSAPGRIAWISPVGGAGQPLAARLVLDNRAGKWTPGMFVNGEVTVGKKPVSLAVPLTAVQSLRDWKVVFAHVGDVYEARPLVLGRDDGECVEVTGGHLAVAIVSELGIYNYQNLPIDAVPDITNVQVQINTEAPGYSPLETKQRITFAVETAMAGLPDLEYTRSISRYDLSQVTVVFKDGTDLYLTRQLVGERIQEVRAQLPANIEPTMGPLATGLGAIFMHTVTAEPGALQADGSPYDSTALRTVQDWIVRPQLRQVPGIIEVNSIGGYARQLHVTPDPAKLLAWDMTFSEVLTAL